jgi:RimK family alpha-L-glutamate ligase
MVVVFGTASNTTNVELVRHWRTGGIDATLAPRVDGLFECDVVVGRLDVVPTLDGVEPGLLTLLRLERRGTAVVNPAFALLAVHDKLLTARRLSENGLPHPPTVGWRGVGPPPLAPPVVLKPRFGSWGCDVVLCRDREELERAVTAVRERAWFRRHGVLLQHVVPSPGHDLRLIVAGEHVVGACRRIAAPGEWRTNVSVGGSRRRVDPPPEARSLAIAAAQAVEAAFVGVDLMPIGADRYVVLELNGAVDFDQRYALDGGDVYLEAARCLGLPRSLDLRPVRGVPRQRRR